jgi:hypothetical protein
MAFHRSGAVLRLRLLREMMLPACCKLEYILRKIIFVEASYVPGFTSAVESSPALPLSVLGKVKCRSGDAVGQHTWMRGTLVRPLVPRRGSNTPRRSP